MSPGKVFDVTCYQDVNICSVRSADLLWLKLTNAWPTDDARQVNQSAKSRPKNNVCKVNKWIHKF